jgi:hypothetical protein
MGVLGSDLYEEDVADGTFWRGPIFATSAT